MSSRRGGSVALWRRTVNGLRWGLLLAAVLWSAPAAAPHPYPRLFNNQDSGGDNAVSLGFNDALEGYSVGDNVRRIANIGGADKDSKDGDKEMSFRFSSIPSEVLRPDSMSGVGRGDKPATVKVNAKQVIIPINVESSVVKENPGSAPGLSSTPRQRIRGKLRHKRSSSSIGMNTTIIKQPSDTSGDKATSGGAAAPGLAGGVGFPTARNDSSSRQVRSRGPAPTTAPRQLQCTVNQSCSVRQEQSPRNANKVHKYPCRCDDQCHFYGDCCHDHPGASQPPPAPAPTCTTLTPTAHRPPASPRTVFLMDSCPAGTARQLAARCRGAAPPHYLMDIPVFSNTSGIGYSNIFCAKCHHDANVYKLKMGITCTGDVVSITQLANMTYHPGELRWSAPDEPHNDSSEASEPVRCTLDVEYPESVGRWCEPELVDTCKNWPEGEHKEQCSAYSYFVESAGKVYKNQDCAICNGVPEEEIQCLFLFSLGTRFMGPPPSLTELFEVNGNCEDDEVWDAVQRRCEHVSCGFLFKLVDTKCVRNNETTPDDGQSYLTSSCYTAKFSRNLSVLFPNESVYLNETQQLYTFGEYELYKSWVIVCDHKERWTSTMSIISAVLISISLVCLLLHIAIFLALPKRRNIPSMNLFSMTCALFIAEFLFMTVYHLNSNFILCYISSVVFYYFISASFLWMNVMSIDICRTFFSSTYRMKSRTVFIQYSLYAWLVPLLAVVVAVLVDQVWSDFVLAPHLATAVCWFNNKWGLVAFFTLPSSLVILINMVLYSMSVYNIYKQMKSGEMASSTIRKNGSNGEYTSAARKEGQNFLKPSDAGRKVSASSGEKSSDESDSPRCKERIRDRIHRRLHAQKKQRVRLVLYCKLALMMGMTWVFAFISIHTNNIIFEYLFLVFNGLQGAFIFISFDLKQKVWEELRHRISGSGEQTKTSSTRLTNTRSTSANTSSDTGYKYRWSSRRRPESMQGYSTASRNIGETQPSQEGSESEV